jgi:hypothetical protein
MERQCSPASVRHPEAKPTPRQVYALAHELARRAGEEFPATRGAASELIERLRLESDALADSGPVA